MATESTVPVPRGLAPSRMARNSLRCIVTSFWALTKPDINLLIAITVFSSFGLAVPFSQNLSLPRLLNAMLGTLLVSSGAAILNQFMERKHDALMRRTARRPMVLGGISPLAAVTFGTCVSAIGIVHLEIFANSLSSLIAGAALGIYLVLYTPLKRVTPLCTWVGAISGAAPPLIGWAAASGSLNDPRAWILYTTVFLWQFPHFTAIAWMYRRDYDRAGYMVLPRCKSRNRFAALQSVFPALLLVPCTIIPSLIGVEGSVYLAGSLLLGIVFVYCAFRLARHRSNSAARQLLFASIIYLPSVLFLMLLDKR